MTPNSSCSYCGKALSDPVSVEIGVGPVCRITNKIKEMSEKTENLFASRALFEYGFEGDVLWITDEGGFKSVTNDMENVLEDIMDTVGHVKLRGNKIMYRDSMGIWDGVRVTWSSIDTIECISFFPLTEKDPFKAKDKLKSL